MTFEEWRNELAHELSKVFGCSLDESTHYIESTGVDCWRESFDDGLSPRDAAVEEAQAEAMAG